MFELRTFVSEKTLAIVSAALGLIRSEHFLLIVSLFLNLMKVEKEIKLIFPPHARALYHICRTIKSIQCTEDTVGAGSGRGSGTDLGSFQDIEALLPSQSALSCLLVSLRISYTQRGKGAFLSQTSFA